MQDKLNLKELDQKLARLKEIGLKEISKSTKLASSKIEDVLEKRFDKLDRVRARGFINILEREYEMDLSDWLKAQYEHTNKKSITNVSQMIARQDEQNEQSSDSQKSQEKTHEGKVLDIALKVNPIGHSQKESQISPYVILGLILFLLIAYFAYKAFMDDRLTDQNLQSESKQKASNQIQDVDSQNASSTYEGIFFDPSQSPIDSVGVNNREKLENNIEQKSQAIQEFQTSNIQAQDLLQPTREFTESTLHNDANLTSNPSQKSMESSAVSMQTTPELDAVKNDILYIHSTQELWLGVIYLDTGKKEQFLYKDRYEVKISGKMLFVMGHANFTLSLNGENITHGAKPPVRMYYDGSTFTDVSFTRFKQLNGGAEW